MSSDTPAFDSFSRKGNGSTTRLDAVREFAPRSIIVVSGALAVPGTSSARARRVLGEPFVLGSDSTSSSRELRAFDGARLALCPTLGSAPVQQSGTQQALSELRRLSGLTWDQLGEVFGVSRRTVHFWASGRDLTAANERRLMRVLDLVRLAGPGDARRTRSALLEARAGVTPFDLLRTEQFDAARAMLAEATARRTPATSTSTALDDPNRPPAPDILVDALQDRVHQEVGRARPARTARNKRRGDR